MIQKYSGIWTDKQLKQLLRRSLFGVTIEDYNYFKGKSMDECIDVLLASPPTPVTPIYYDTEDLDNPVRPTWVFNEKESEEKAEVNKRMLFIKIWWIDLMRTQRNITERMVLFWHNHFATEFSIVNDTRYNFQYVALLRQYATGNFRKLLKEMTTNPQMLVYLNGNVNNKAEPNENYAREVQELFTVGKGADSHYTEEDVKNAAKVLTGWKDDKRKISSYFDPAFHNTDDKIFSSFYNKRKIKGRSGADGAEETFEMLEMLCNQRETSKFLCRKLYRWFVGCTIDEQVEKNIIDPLADIMIQSNYEIKPVLKAILSGEFFYEPFLTGGIIKSPVDFVVELFRQFSISNPLDPNGEWKLMIAMSMYLSSIGQDIGDPPAVAGWPAYYTFPLYDREWIPSDRLSMRDDLIKGVSEKLNKIDPENNAIPDLITFVSALSKPGNHEQLLNETIDLFFCVPLGPSQISYLRSLLDKSNNYTQNWNELWAMYCSSPNREDLREEVKDRLRITFKTMLTFPEYQIR